MYIYTMEYNLAIKKEEIMAFAATWIDLKFIILSDVSQIEKDKYHMISLVQGILVVIKIHLYIIDSLYFL